MAEVSIIVPVYNVEEYLRRCIESIIGQTFRDFDLILVDDGSTDASGLICDEYTEKYPFVKTIHLVNSGQAKARNVGIENSRSEWIMFVDSDDVIHPKTLEYLYSAANERGSRICACFRDETDLIPDTFADVEYSSQSFTADEAFLLKLYNSDSGFKSIFWIVYAKIIKREIVESCLFAEGRIYEDNALTCKWLIAAGTVSVVPEYMYYYRNNPNGTMNQRISEKKLDYIWALGELLSFFKSLGYDEMRGAIAREYIFTSLWISEQVKTELNNPLLARKLIHDAVRVNRDNSDCLNLSESEKRKLFKAAHPLIHKIKKHLTTQ
ncbi:MAG: glycosyltransferase family 2 protein [Clostridia bacterium]|nr:glycosyltransferase family 2 protein [Clostridia bacterium]